MRVLFGRSAVRGPSRVPQAVISLDRIFPDGVFKVPQLPARAPHLQFPLGINQRDSGRIVAAIFQPPKPFDNDRQRRLSSHVSDDPTHTISSEKPSTKITK